MAGLGNEPLSFLDGLERGCFQSRKEFLDGLHGVVVVGFSGKIAGDDSKGVVLDGQYFGGEWCMCE